MSEDAKTRTAKSVRDRLLTTARQRGESFDLVLLRYAMERFLVRLARSPYRDELILKGAMLFAVWSDAPHRATRDLDLLARGETAKEAIAAKLRTILKADVEEDGLDFGSADLVLEEIRETNRYGGVRARFSAGLGSARIPLQIDFGVGDAVTPGPIETGYPTLLGTEPPSVLAYPRETVIAEKLEAITVLGMDNSRMKDYFDLWFIATTFRDDPTTLIEAVRQTFERRGTPLPTEMPVGLTDAFIENSAKQAQWKAFVGRSVRGGPTLGEAVWAVRTLLHTILSVPHENLS